MTTGIYDAVVVGGGLSGSLCAYLLQKKGYKTLIIETKKVLGRKVCGEYLCPAGVRLLEDLRLIHLLENFPKILGMKLVSPSGIEIDTSFPQNQGIETFGVAANREILDRRIQSMALGEGCDHLLGETVREIESINEGYRLTTSNKTEHRTRFLVGADGMQSTVARKLRLHTDFIGGRTALHCYLPHPLGSHSRGEMHILKDGSYLGLDPTGASETNVTVVCDLARLKKEGGGEHTLRSVLKEAVGFSQVDSLPEILPVRSSFPITKRVKSVSARRAALIGDASGFLDPLTGEGMFVALWTARQLALALPESTNLSREKTVNQACLRYASSRTRQFLGKTWINNGFQWLIQHEAWGEKAAEYLQSKASRGNSLIGLIGNNYSPFQGLVKLALS